MTTFLSACSDGDNRADDTGSDDTTAVSVSRSDVDDAPADAAAVDPEPRAATTTELRTGLTGGGNRFLDGRGSILGAPTSVDLPSEPVWVLPWPDVDQPGWLVTLTDGSSTIVDDSGDGVRPGPELPDDVADGAPPIVVVAADGGPLEVRSAYADHQRFDDPLPDTRVVSDGSLTAALVTPTDRYAHAVLGDSFEAAAVELIDEIGGTRTRIEIGEPAVIEGIAPLLADVDGDGETDVLVTISDAGVGAQLAAYRRDGTLLAASDPIGQGRRWRNQLAVGPVGPNGEVEVVDVRTPHIGGTVEFFRPDGTSLVRVAASEPRFTSHQLGSRNLDLAVMADGDGDGRADVIVPTQDRSAFAVITRTEGEPTGDGVLVEEVDVEGSISTNLSVRSVGGQLGFAVGIKSGTDDHALVVWPG